MSDLTMTIVYDDIPPIQARDARWTLRAATGGLRLLNACERATTRKRAKIVWSVNIYSLADRAVIEFSAVESSQLARIVIEKSLKGIAGVVGGVMEGEAK